MRRETLKSCAVALLLCTLCFGWSGCAYNYTFRTSRPPSTERITEWRHIGLWGWIGASPFNLKRACPRGVSEFGSYVSFPNWMCAFVTAGLYTPRTVYAIPAERRKEALHVSH